MNELENRIITLKAIDLTIAEDTTELGSTAFVLRVKEIKDSIKRCLD